MAEELKVRALHDFDPKQMSYRELLELKHFLKNQGLLIETERNIFGETIMDRLVGLIPSLVGLCPFELPLDKCEKAEKETLSSKEYVIFKDDCKHNRNLYRLGLPVSYKQYIPWKLGLWSRKEYLSLEKADIKRGSSVRCGATVRYIKGAMLSVFKLAHMRTREETSDIKSKEEKIKTEWLKRVMRKSELMTDEEDHASSDSEEEDRYSLMVTFKRGDKMATVHPANICDTVGWWMVRNLDSGEIGFIPRHHIVIEHDQQTSNTSLKDIPLELLDIVLEKSFLHWMLNPSPNQKDEDVVKALASVEFCWFQRITRRRFKKRIWRGWKDFYGNYKKLYGINRNNQNYLVENIQPNDDLIALLLSHNCITEENKQLIQRRRSNRDKNIELLKIMRDSDETKFSNFVKSLRQKNQKSVAWILENGGVAIKIEVLDRGAVDTQVLHKKIEDLRNKIIPRSYTSNDIIRQIKDMGIDILDSDLDRQTVVVWIWCVSQAGFDYMHYLQEENLLGPMTFLMADRPIPKSASKVFNIDNKQFRKKIVTRWISVDFTKTMDVGARESLHGLTKLINEIYVLYKSGIHVYEDQNPFSFKKRIEISKEIEEPEDIGSSEKEKCLYVSDQKEKCVWKITHESGDQYKFIKWLAIDYQPRTLSMTRHDQLLVVSDSSSSLMIYGSDAELIRSIDLPKEIVKPIHAVETSIGNFIILHSWEENRKKVESSDTGRKSMEEEEEDEEEVDEKRMEKEVGENGSSRSDSDKKEKEETKFGICEVRKDGQMVIRRFIPLDEKQNLQNPKHFTLDSDDRVFLTYNNENVGLSIVIMFDSDLVWERIACETNKDEIETHQIKRVYYDNKNKQLIVAGESDVEEGVHVYTINRI